MTEDFIKNYIDTAIRKGTLAPSYIIEGADKEAIFKLAKNTAAALLCKGDADKEKPCGACHSCKLIASGNHPDCIVVTHEKPTVLSVDEIREQVVRDVAVRPYYGGRKIYIIPDSELMGPGSQNALLKTIEEPPEYVLILLLVENRQRLLETIRSRCVKLSFSAEPEFHTDDEAVALQFTRIEEFISDQERFGMADAISFAKELANNYKSYLPDLLTHIEVICRDALFEKSGMDLTSAGKAGYIKKTAEIPYEGLEQILKAVQSARHDLLINVTAEAVLDSLLLHIKQAASTKT